MRHRTKPRVDTNQVPSLVYNLGVRVKSQRGAPSQCARDTGNTCRHERSDASEEAQRARSCTSASISCYRAPGGQGKEVGVSLLNARADDRLRRASRAQYGEPPTALF